MAKRKTSEQKAIDKAIRVRLDELGKKITVEVRRTSKIAKSTETFTGGSLRDSVNYKPLKNNSLLLSENNYGKWNTPKGVKTPPKAERDNIKDNPMLNAIENNLDETVNFIIKDLTEILTVPITGK